MFNMLPIGMRTARNLNNFQYRGKTAFYIKRSESLLATKQMLVILFEKCIGM